MASSTVTGPELAQEQVQVQVQEQEQVQRSCSDRGVLGHRLADSRDAAPTRWDPAADPRGVGMAVAASAGGPGRARRTGLGPES